jgi:hemoglobin
MATQTSTTIFERIGGEASVDAAVELFYEKVLADEALAPFFDGVNVKAQRRQQKAFLTAALGGPGNYRGRDMKAAHSRLDIEEKHFGLVAGHLVATLGELGVSSDLIDEIVAVVAPLKDDIVGPATA